MIPKIKDLPHMERLHQLNLWTLEERRTRTDLIKVYKIIHGLTTVKFESFFEFEKLFQKTRPYLQVKEESFQQGSASPFFTGRIINMWNSLNERTVTASTLNCFKRNMEYLRNSTKMGLIWTDVARPWADLAGYSKAASGKLSGKQ